MTSLFTQELGGYDASGNYTGDTVNTGSAGTVPPKAPPKADAIRNKTLVSGLCDALNEFQAELVKKGTYQYPDTYKIVIVDAELEDAKVVPPGETNLKQTPMIQSQDPATQKLGSKQAVNTNAKGTKITAGTSIVQFIDQVTRTSTYIYDQQTKLYDPKTGELKDNGTPAETVGWYRIGMEAEPKLDQYDTKRGDYAYNITYSLNIYAVSDVKSDFFPSPRFRGTQKKYNYWFTGENTQILDFTQDYNYLYYIVSNGPAPPRTTTSNFREIEKKFFQPNSNQSSQGQDDQKINEPSANAADYLYSPGDQSRVKLRILGDPAWIFQGETWSGIQGLKFNYGPFLADGTINYEGQEILFELAFNKPVDYNTSTGIADPTTKNYQRSATSAGDAQQSFVYKTVECISHFSRGKFEQELHGVMMIYPLSQEKPSTAAANARTEGRTGANSPVASTAAGTNKASRTSETAAEIDKRLQDKYGIPPVGTDTEFDNALIGATVGTPASDTGLSNTQPLAPTSGGRVVGPAASGQAAVASQGGASGTAVGAPSTFVVLNNGGGRTVTSQAEIDALVSSGQANTREAGLASRALSARQQAANSPTSSAPTQKIKREY